MKKVLAFILSIACVAGIFTACTTANNNSAQENELPNPIVAFDSAKELAAETKLNITLPDSVSDIKYSAIIDGESEPVAQADFLYGEKECTYRMQYAKELTDISGVYQEYKNTEDIEITTQSADSVSSDADNTSAQITQSEESVKCTLKYTEGEYGIALWYDENTSVTHCVSMDNCTKEELANLVTEII